MFNVMLAAALVSGSVAVHAESTIVLRNNHEFGWRMPVRVHLAATNNGPQVGSDGQPVQWLDGDAVLIAAMMPSEEKRIELHPGHAAPVGPGFKIETDGPGVRLIDAGQKLGRLSWGLDLHPVKATKGELVPPANVDAEFKPLSLKFHREEHGPMFDRWLAQTTQAGLQVRIELLAYVSEFLDINIHVTNASADAEAKTYAAVICRWEQPALSSQTLCYNNRKLALSDHDRSPYRSGPGRQQFVQRGADWVRSALKNGWIVAWMNDFAPSFTVLDNTTNNTFHQPRYAGANLSQLGWEVQSAPHRLYSITEIARADSNNYHDRLTENVLPAKGEGVSFSSRLFLTWGGMSEAQADQTFVAYTSYNAQHVTPEGATVAFGTPNIRFGTSYFPYSTLGENFDDLKLPGMDRESFWPLAADTVLQWKLFADDICRDLRIAKAMGFQLIRLHHLELLAAIPADIRQEYLDFLFGQLRELKLRALLDVYASPAQLRELVARYRDVVDGVELENETLIWGIPLDRPEQWKAEYDAVKQTAPEIPVNLTGYNNTGMFNRLEQLGVKFDRVDLHSYIDSLELIPDARGYALALGSYASKVEKPPMISEWNWRSLTRMSEEARAKIYPPIIDNALATRAIPDFYEFQFNETMAPNPRLGRGNVLRHYELLNLSRRPKAEAFELMKLIQHYSPSNDSIRIIDAPHVVEMSDEHSHAQFQIPFTNLSAAPLHLTASVENFDGMKTDLRTNATLTVAPGQTAVLPIAVTLPAYVPGFYHLFVRLESDTGLLRYLWAELRVPNAPEMEPGSVTNFNFSMTTTVAYGEKATVLEVETAFAIGQTLESASGMVVPILPLNDVPKDALSHIIFVGSDKETPPAQRGWLMIGGKNTREVERAGMKFILSYWTKARDSAARKVGLARKDLPKGGDAAKLP